MKPFRCFSLLLGLLAVPAALAQPTFTELALTDSLFTTPSETDFWVSSVAPADVDGDGDLDLLVLGYYVVYFQSAEDLLVLYRNDGPDGADGWTFTPELVPLGDLSSGADDLAWADYDNDGDPDVVVGTAGGTALYRNDGGTLVPTQTALPDYREDSDFSTLDLRSISWADYDNDGDPDLLFPSVREGFEYVATRLLRNDGPDAGDAWLFTDTEAALDTTSNAVSVWGDNDGDEDLDLLLANVTVWEPGNNLSIFRNDGGALARDTTGVVRIRYGTADWGDADGDGDLDIVYCGNIDLPDGTGETVVRILLNQGNGLPYEPLTVLEDGAVVGEYWWLDFLAVTWADYDGDGDVDLLVAGEMVGNGEIVGRSVVYTNDGAGAFTPAPDLLPAPVAGNAGGAFTWFDLDNDGDLDHFVAGGYFVVGGGGLLESRAQLFRNDSGAALARGGNAPPSAPGALQAAVDGGDVHLTWAPATDDSTPQASLTYELRVRPLGAPVPSDRPLPEAGNVSLNTGWTLHGLPGGTYAWRVQALDNAFAAGPPAEGTFTVDASPVALAVSVPGGSVQVPPGGGSFSFTVTLTNLTGQPLRGEAWTEVDGPVSASPVMGPRAVTLAAGASLTRTVTQTVPAGAPAGAYTYAVHVGRFPGVTVASRAFEVTKASGRASGPVGVPGTAAEPSGWSVSGWDGGATASASALPEGFALSEAHPNPSHGSVRLTLDLAAGQHVTAEVYDALGRRVAVLLDGAAEAGAHALVLDGSALPAGVYVVRVAGEGFSATRRVTLVR